MKHFFTILSIFALLSQAQAHPTDDTTFEKVPVQSSIVISKDINILPQQRNLLLSSSSASFSCHINLYWDMSNEDRTLQKGTTFTVLDVSNELGLFGKFVLAYGDKTYDMTCWSKERQGRFQMSIGDLKSSISELAELRIAPPKNM